MADIPSQQPDPAATDDVDEPARRPPPGATAPRARLGDARARTPWVRPVDEVPGGEGGEDGEDAGQHAAVTGIARVDARTKTLVSRLFPGELAFVDHVDLDPMAAQALIRARVGAVVNAAPSISGRYPNVGPLMLVAAGIPLVDDAGPAAMRAVAEGDVVTVVGGDVHVDGEVVARGTRQTLLALNRLLETARQTVGVELERFAANTLEHLRREAHLLTDSPHLPHVRVPVAGRHVLVVVRGPGCEDDLVALRSYIGEMRPVLIGVDGGADLLLAHGYAPELIIGDFDSVSDAALDCGAQLVVHAYPGGEAPGAARLEDLGLPYDTFEATGTSEDIAMLLAYEERAELIVAVGTHASMVEFFDKGREGMASTFLVRLKVGPILVDAKGVSRLYHSRVRKSDMMFLVGAAVVAMLAMALVAPPLHVFLRALWFIVTDAWHALAG